MAYSPDEPRDDRGRWTSGGNLKERDWESPKPPQGKSHTKNSTDRFGMAASGETATKLGDLGEKLALQHFGMKSLLPEGKRQNPLDAAHHKNGFEIKTMTTSSTEYKIKMKTSEVREKEKYAKAAGLKPHTMAIILDHKSGTAHAYVHEGITNGRIAQERGWKFVGKIKK